MPRAGLTRARVVAEAAEVADQVGYEQLTLAAVAQRTGVRLPSLYKHVDSLDALRRDLAVLALRDLGRELTDATVGRSRSAALLGLAHAYLGYARAHPGRYAATVRAPREEDGEHAAAADAVLRVVLAILGGYDLDGEDGIDAARVLRSALHGFVSLERAGGFGLPRDVDRSYDRLVRAVDTALTGWRADAVHTPVGERRS
jgi:AcrR family transcriptional regulator